MITIVTTHNLEIFKIFYTHKFHEMFRENLYLYVDKEDSSEFRKIVDPDKTKIFDRNDFKKYYKEKYLTSLTTFSKIYFLDMLFKMNLINDSFYFTDDDILLVDESFKDLELSDKAIYAKDMFLIIHKLYHKWPLLYDYIKKNFNDNYNLACCATNFYFPKRMVNDLGKEFNKVFDEFIDILYKNKSYIESLNSKSRSGRNVDFSIFYLDTPFFNIIFPRLGLENYKLCQINLTSYSHFRILRDKLETNDTYKILEKYFSKKIFYPKKQPLYHYSVTNKLPLLKDSYNYLNNKDIEYKDVNDILYNNPRERKKLEIKEYYNPLF